MVKKRIPGIRLRECGEPLVDIKLVCPQVIIRLDSDRRPRTAYVRRGVARKVKQALRYLPKGMTFVIRDAWRPMEVQEQILRTFISKFYRLHPEWTLVQARKEACKYVADAYGPYASGHMTGAAIDMRLWKNGQRLPMRSWNLSYQENAHPYPKKLAPFLRRNRKILYDALRKAGFSQCHNEFWHWSYGDVHWARRTGRKVAIYGVVNKR